MKVSKKVTKYSNEVLVLRYYSALQVWLIDMAIPGGSRINQKEVEKITKYQDLKVEVERL